MIACALDGHRGRIDVSGDGCCVFYGILFESIVCAAGFLRGVKAGPIYKGKIFRGVKILKDVEMDMWLSAGRWWPDKTMAVNAAKRNCRV